MYPHSEHVETQRHRLRCRPTLASCMLAMAAAAMAHAAAADVRVFTDRHHAVEAPVGIHVVKLDAPARIEAELAVNLPADPAQAAAPEYRLVFAFDLPTSTAPERLCDGTRLEPQGDPAVIRLIGAFCHKTEVHASATGTLPRRGGEDGAALGEILAPALDMIRPMLGAV